MNSGNVDTPEVLDIDGGELEEKAVRIPVSVYADLIVADFQVNGDLVEKNVIHPDGRVPVVNHTQKKVVIVRRYSSYSRKIGRGQKEEYGNAYPEYGVRLHFLIESRRHMANLNSRIPELEGEGLSVTWEWAAEEKPVTLRLGDREWASATQLENELKFTAKYWTGAREESRETFLDILNFPHHHSPRTESRFSRIQIDQEHLFAIDSSTQSPIMITTAFITKSVDKFIHWRRHEVLQSTRLGQMASEGGYL